MILKDKDSTKIFIECGCGCSGLQLQKYTWNCDGKNEYYIYHMISSFDAHQQAVLYKLKRKLKIIWKVLINGFYVYNQIFLTEEQFKELKKAILEFE